MKALMEEETSSDDEQNNELESSKDLAPVTPVRQNSSSSKSMRVDLKSPPFKSPPTSSSTKQKKSKRSSKEMKPNNTDILEALYYAQVNGEDPAELAKIAAQADEVAYDSEELDFPDHNSFANLTFGTHPKEQVTQKNEEPAVTLTGMTLSTPKPKRSSLSSRDSNGSKNSLTMATPIKSRRSSLSSRDSNGSKNSLTMSTPNARRSSLSSRGSTRRSFESGSTGSTGGSSEQLSVEDAKQFIMAQIPEELRAQIPQHAWNQIFHGDSSFSRASTGSGNGSSSGSHLDAMEEEEQEDYADLDASQSSDISALTEAVLPSSPQVATKEKALDASTSSWDVPAPWETSPTTSPAPGIPVPPMSATEEMPSRGPIRPPTLNVSFSDVQVRYYERILEENPSVQSGPAIGIGWRYRKGGTEPVDAWESKRGGRPRRSNELVLSRLERERILKEVGYTAKDIAAAVRQIRKLKDKRKQTVNNLGAAGMEEAVESARQKMKLLLMGRKRKE